MEITQFYINNDQKYCSERKNERKVSRLNNNNIMKAQESQNIIDSNMPVVVVEAPNQLHSRFSHPCTNINGGLKTSCKDSKHSA